MRVAACIPTRGDHDLTEIVESIPEEWEVVIWDNSKVEDLSVFGRYMAITLTDAEVIYVQDDDAVLAPASFEALLAAYTPGKIVANMPARFRHDFYVDHCLVGFGAIFDRELPAEAFRRFIDVHEATVDEELFWQTCDVAFTILTPRLLVDLEYRDMPYASDPDRMWKQPEHVARRVAMLGLAREVRDS